MRRIVDEVGQTAVDDAHTIEAQAWQRRLPRGGLTLLREGPQPPTHVGPGARGAARIQQRTAGSRGIRIPCVARGPAAGSAIGGASGLFSGASSGGATGWCVRRTQSRIQTGRAQDRASKPKAPLVGDIPSIDRRRQDVVGAALARWQSRGAASTTAGARLPAASARRRSTTRVPVSNRRRPAWPFRAPGGARRPGASGARRHGLKGEKGTSGPGNARSRRRQLGRRQQTDRRRPVGRSRAADGSGGQAGRLPRWRRRRRAR